MRPNIKYNFGIPSSFEERNSYDMGENAILDYSSDLSHVVKNDITNKVKILGCSVVLFFSSVADDKIKAKPADFTFNFQQAVSASLDDTIIDSRVEYKERASIIRNEWKKELSKIALYEDNWDAEGAIKVPHIVLGKAIQLLDFTDINIHLIQDIYANPSGTISIEWGNTNDETIGVEVGARKMSYYTSLRGDEDCFFNSLLIDKSNLTALFDRVRRL